MTARARALGVVVALVTAAQAGPSDAPATATIEFDAAIRRAIANNPTRRVALLEIARTQGLLAQATAALLPQVGTGGAYTRLEGDRFVNMTLFQAANSFDAAATLAMPIVDFNAYANRRRAADNVDTAAADGESTKRDIAIATARVYFAAFTAARFVDIAQHARDTARGHVDFAASRRRGGLGTELDLSRARTELATDEAQLASAQTSLARTQAALGVITGTDAPLAAGAAPIFDTHVGGGIAERADVLASRLHRDAADRSSELDWTLWAPTLRVAGDGFFTAPQLPPIPRFGYSLVFTLQIPIYEGGLRHGIHAQHEAELAQAREREIGVERQARSEIDVAETTLGRSRLARDAARDAAQLAARTLELATVGYQAGNTSELEVIDAERAARDTATQAAIAENDLREAELDLLAATGAFPR
jgi:outer membrane protein TolC